MNRTWLKAIEELLPVAQLSGVVYGATITQNIIQQTGPRIVLRAVPVALYCLEEKGRVTSAMCGTTPERGGYRRKRRIISTTCGMRMLPGIRQVREGFPQWITKPIQLAVL